MDALKSWGMTVCLAALAAGIAGIITPSGKLEKSFRFAVSLFFLCCMLVPLFSLKNIRLSGMANSFGVSNAVSENTGSLKKTVSSQAAENARNSIADLIRQCCSQNGVIPVSVTINLKTESGKMSVPDGAVTVTLKKSDFGVADTIRTAVKEKYGIVITVKEGES